MKLLFINWTSAVVTCGVFRVFTSIHAFFWHASNALRDFGEKNTRINYNTNWTLLGLDKKDEECKEYQESGERR